MSVRLSDETIKIIKKSEHILTTISIESAEQSGDNFEQFIRNVLEINDNIRITIILTGYLYASSYASLKEGAELTAEQIVQKGEDLDEKWKKNNKSIVELIQFINQNSTSSPQIKILGCDYFFNLIDQHHANWKNKIASFIASDKCKANREQLIKIFSRKLKKEMYRKMRQDKNITLKPNQSESAIQAAVEKFLIMETTLSAFYRKLANKPIKYAAYGEDMDFDAEFYPGKSNQLFSLTFNKFKLDNIPWSSYEVLRSPMYQDDNFGECYNQSIFSIESDLGSADSFTHSNIGYHKPTAYKQTSPRQNSIYSANNIHFFSSGSPKFCSQSYIEWPKINVNKQTREIGIQTSDSNLLIAKHEKILFTLLNKIINDDQMKIEFKVHHINIAVSTLDHIELFSSDMIQQIRNTIKSDHYPDNDKLKFIQNLLEIHHKNCQESYDDFDNKAHSCATTA